LVSVGPSLKSANLRFSNLFCGLYQAAPTKLKASGLVKLDPGSAGGGGAPAGGRRSLDRRWPGFSKRSLHLHDIAAALEHKRTDETHAISGRPAQGHFQTLAGAEGRSARHPR
jgi:hypothetical protein